MKTIILCGGKGTRMKEETEFKPKPMVTVGGQPLLWHIMKIYAHAGFNDFLLALGYKGDMVKNHFLNHRLLQNDFTLQMKKKEVSLHNPHAEDFNISFIDTGLESITGERVLRLKKHLTDDEFMVTYGDGFADIDIRKLVDFHRAQGTLATVTGAHPQAKYGMVAVEKGTNLATGFDQKPLQHDYVNGGFMVFNKRALEYMDNGALEDAFPRLIADRELSIFQHDGFWKPMDTYREVEEMNELWHKGDRPWAVWEK